MITAQDLIAKVQSYNPKSDADLIARAYAFGAAAHEGQTRKSGEPYFTHPVAVAILLTEVKLDDATIVTALLHDTIEDTKATYQQVANTFSPEIAKLVDGVTKLTNLELSSVETEQAENFRKLLMAMSKDLRVLLVKLADRLHNMRTIRSMPKEKQRQKAHETMEIYAPLAGRMGMQFIREELEDLCFSVLNPEARNSIMRRFINLSKENDDLIPRITEDIRIALNTANVEARVTGREKRPYSIWRKMQEKNEPFNRLSDIYGFRIITENVQDAYIALGAVHQRWSAVPGRFKDYISEPKSNGYRSIHTTVSGRNAKRVEVQIRTRQMHQVAESGVAAHWSYRGGQRAENPFAVDPFRWLRSLAERFEASENPDDFLEHVKLEMFQDQVFCFTPKGEVIKLPRGASPIDFAYAIHTGIGDSCVGAKVNGARVPLWTKLRNGQSVEIIRAEGQRPQASWEDMVVTGRAKSAIRRYMRDEHRDAHIRLGREIARVSLGRVNKKPTDKALETAAKLFNLNDGNALLALIGSADISGSDLVQTLYPELVKSGSSAGPASDEERVIGLSPNQSATPAPCCSPVPGERIVGIAMPGRGVLIHAIDCPILEQFEGNDRRWVDLRWTPDSSRACNETKIEVAMANDAGVLGRICTLIGEHRANIVDIRFTNRKPDFYRIRLDIMVRDIEHLTNVETALKADSDVAEVIRFRDTSLCELAKNDSGESNN
ncbi:MAG: bifunctional (p)ppGpp synthetase/guanosine-3',5'-bis(diphosphate) 3'-pyrophosphohydrolase [Rhodobacteraceae bacterium]|nr:bifunctional (p)ppGpp synthetase/guanosine-3',5'-bis(diphosphate) 3'-pyrophosphohydrolase [Paracoccaceae bacterium]